MISNSSINIFPLLLNAISASSSSIVPFPSISILLKSNLIYYYSLSFKVFVKEFSNLDKNASKSSAERTLFS